MTKRQLQEALSLALSNETLNEDLRHFDGFGLPGYKPVYTTVRALAKLLRYQCVQFNGQLDHKELNAIAQIGRTKFMVL